MRTDSNPEADMRSRKALARAQKIVTGAAWLLSYVLMDTTFEFHFWRFLNITFAFPGMRTELMIRLRGACFPTSNLMS